MELPVPVCGSHDLCKRASKTLKKYSHSRPSTEQLLVHWQLQECGLIVHGGDLIKLLLKASYRPKPAVEKEHKAHAASHSSSEQSVRFFTAERRVYVPKQASGMTALLRSGSRSKPRVYLDCHQAGTYAMEVEETKLLESDLAADGRLGARLVLPSADQGPTSFRLASLTLALDPNELLKDLVLIKGCENSLISEQGRRSKPSSSAHHPRGALAVEMVRNLDTGELIHITEVEERVATGTPPRSLRPLAGSTLAGSWFDWILGRPCAPLPLELCCAPLPPISISGEALSGSTLRVHVARDRFAVGDGLARHIASTVRQVTWRRQRCAAHAGEILKVGAPSEGYTLNADDVGYMLTASWKAADGRLFTAQTASVQPQPSMRDEVAALVSSRKAAFEVSHVGRDGESLRGGSLRIDSASRTIEMSRSSRPIRRAKAKPLSRFCRATLDSCHPTRLDVTISARRRYKLQASSSYERDLLALTLRAFLEAFPPPDSPSVPMLVGDVAVEEADALPTSCRALSVAEDHRLPGNTWSAGPVLMHRELHVSYSRCLHASGIEFSWYRTSRAGIRSLIPEATDSTYMPNADDFGCTMHVELTPYFELQPWNADGCVGGDSDCSDESEDDGDAAASGAPTRQRLWGNPVFKALPQEVLPSSDLEARLQRLCSKGAAEFPVMLLPSPGELRTLHLARNEAQLRSGWGVEARMPFTQHVVLSIERAHDTVVHIEALDRAGRNRAERGFRCALESIQQRDLLAMTFRFFVARRCTHAVSEGVSYM